MKGLKCRVLAVCLLFGMPCAQSFAQQGGQIAFVGAIMAPICTAGSESALLEANATVSGRVFTCDANPHAPNPANTSTYELSIASLTAGNASGSPLLAYFVGYRANAHRAGAKMLTRTYE